MDFSEKVDAPWQHSPDGKKHEVTLFNVSAGMEGERTLKLSVSSNKLGVEKADALVTVSVPDQNDFSVYDVTYVVRAGALRGGRFHEVIGCGPRYERFGLYGREYVGDRNRGRKRATRRIRMPDLWQKGVMNIHLNQGIRSKSGLNLKEAVVRQIILDEQKPGVRFIGKGVIIPAIHAIIRTFPSDLFARG